MTYIEEFELELFKKLKSAKPETEIVRWACEIVLASYRNGIKAGRNGETVKRDGKSRRPSIPAEWL